MVELAFAFSRKTDAVKLAVKIGAPSVGFARPYSHIGHLPVGSRVRGSDPALRFHSLVMKCSLCEDCGWVCENHPEKPWEGEHACTCGGAGAPCPECNRGNDEDAPRMPSGFRTVFDLKGWRH